ncbi:galactokinase [Salidesulfovibrio onnuriiensis]|uniref:galactokinase n=1 Tax=Salidesulfovibrio onnuriiensis TaxID=2583823 RepID=UPI0011CC3EBD|nr:galactokinase family protein [Salidesulfovibrio onnuriiensis]
MTAIVSRYRQALGEGVFDTRLAGLYGVGEVHAQRERHDRLLARMEERFGKVPALMVSVPGRTELGGNHTDHNHGRVLAAAVHLDCLAAVAPTGDNTVRIHSEGFSDPIHVDLSDLSPRSEEAGSSEAIVRGVASSLRLRGHNVGGFSACITSAVPMGVGLSSSAAFELLIGSMFNELHNGGAVSGLDMARAAKDAENIHFNKPCGFMDQIACAFPGVSMIDFMDPENPVIESIDGDFEAGGHKLVVVNTGGDHANLTPDYAAIPGEMQRAAQALGRDFCRGITLDTVLGSLKALRERAGDRAILRLIHFIEENDRVPDMAAALGCGDMRRYVGLMLESGDSSWRLLQNCISMVGEIGQPIPLALILSERLLGGRGAWRVHGGGFAGTIQALVPLELLEHYAQGMEAVFGAGAVVPLGIRHSGMGVLRID